MRTCDAAVQVLRETGNPAVMWDDAQLSRQIYERASGRSVDPFVAERRVLSALSRQPGELIPVKTRYAHGRWVRCFRLPAE